MENVIENNNLFGADGIINRRNFIVNILIVDVIIQIFFATPLLVVTFLNQDLMAKVYANSPMPTWWNCVLAISGFVSTILYMPSVIKRIRDILGKSKEDKIVSNAILFFAVMALGILTFVSTSPAFMFIKCFGLGLLVFLMFKKGEYSGKILPSEIAKFNWGAFFGTWIWGVFNKSYIALLGLPLMITPAFFSFALVCGLKGNEWAYEKSQNKELEKFHEKQKKQTIVFSILIPILNIFLALCVFIFGVLFIKNYIDSNPSFANKISQSYAETEAKFAEEKFDKIVRQGDEFKFYLNPKVWHSASNHEKFTIFSMAGSFATLKLSKDKNFKASEISPVLVLNNVKIYSSFNDELLASYYISKENATKLGESLKENYSQLKIMEELKKAYTFNEYPTLP